MLNYGNTSVNNGGDSDAYSLDLEHMWLMSNGGFKARASLNGQVSANPVTEASDGWLGLPDFSWCRGLERWRPGETRGDNRHYDYGNKSECFHSYASAA